MEILWLSYSIAGLGLGIVLVIFMIVAPTILLKQVIKKSENNQNAKNPSDL
jgi:hypothetical protein